MGENRKIQAGIDLVQELKMYLRLIAKVPGYISHRDSPEDGRALLKKNLENRESNFLKLAERSIFGNPASPYLAKLRQAGCDFGDLRRILGEDGLEEALRKLYRAGVYFRFEEFKGRAPTVLNGQEVILEGDRFNNPFLVKHFETSSSGSTGVATRHPKDLDHKAARAPISLAISVAQGFHGLPTARVAGLMPYSSGSLGLVSSGRHGHKVDRWFVPLVHRRPELRYRWAHKYLMTMAKLYRIPLPTPEPLRLEDVIVVAEWAAETLQSKGPCVIHSSVSMALRICLAAKKDGIDLTGVTFRVGGEPMTEAKMAGIVSTGACAFTNYNMSEVGRVGAACIRPCSVNDQHLMKDHLGVIQAPRTIGDFQVDAFMVTTLLPSSPRILLNVEIDDYGIIEKRSCGCPLEGLGLDTHVREVRSFGKLTAEGVTLVGSEMETVLERELPSRFGGSPLDYQLVEEEDERGLTRICILVSPSVPLEDEQKLIETVVAELVRTSLSADLAARLWSHTGAVEVRREAPAVTGRGKVLMLRTDRPRATQATNSQAQL